MPAIYPPRGVAKHFDPAVMRTVEQWVRTGGERMLFIYGAHDPWSASAFTVDAVNDSYRFFVTGANGDHMASINELPAAQRTFVLQKLKAWLDLPGLDAERLGASDIPPRYDPPTRRELFLR